MRQILKDKSGKSMSKTALSLSVIGILLLTFIAYSVMVPENVSQPTTTQDDASGESVCADATVTPSLTIKAYDIENVGTALTESTNLWRYVGSTQWTSFTSGTAFDVDGAKEIEVLMGISTSDFTDNAYGQYFKYTIPCTENPTIERAMANDEVEGSVSATFYNADANAAGEDFSADAPQTVSLKLKALSDEYYGNPFLEDDADFNVKYPNLLILHLNTTAWDKPDQVYLADGTELKSMPVPSRFAIEQTLTSRTAYAYELPVLTDKEIVVKLDLNPDDTTAPAVDDTAYIYAGGYFINAETGEKSWGIENEQNADVATSDPDSITLDFTA